MDIKSLMIGDWVYNKHHGKKIRLTPCDFFTHTHNEFGEQELAPFAKPTIGRDLEPIPLEKIHLAKNGFKADEEDENFIYEDGYEVCISFDGGCKELELEPYIYLNINFAENHLSMEIENLHQLQQAMRIMGCDKEIKL